MPDYAAKRKQLTKDLGKDIAATPQRITAAMLLWLKVTPDEKTR